MWKYEIEHLISQAKSEILLNSGISVLPPDFDDNFINLVLNKKKYKFTISVGLGELITANYTVTIDYKGPIIGILRTFFSPLLYIHVKYQKVGDQNVRSVLNNSLDVNKILFDFNMSRRIRNG
jgi:hypothetical protein